MPRISMRGWSLFCIESFNIANLAYRYGYGLACYTDSQTVFITPGVFSAEEYPSIFSSESMTKKQVREYWNLARRVYAFNSSW